MTKDLEGTRPKAVRLLLKVVVYYAVLIAAGSVLTRWLPRTAAPAFGAFEALFTGAAPSAEPAVASATAAGLPLAITVSVAMIAAVLLSLPVGWIYLLTRARRGFQQSVVQLLVVLPMVISGIVVMVKYSVALAFSLAGIVAAVRFRNTLDDSKDAVFVFLATGIGFASGIDLPVALAISIVFNVTILALWYTNFGHAPVDSEVAMKEVRLRMPTREYRVPTREYKVPVADVDRLVRLRVMTKQPDETRRALERGLDAITKRWTFDRVIPGTGEGDTLEYMLTLKKKTQPEEVLDFARRAGATVQAELA